MKTTHPHLWKALVDTELATAATPLSGDLIDRTARAYAQTGQSDIALHVLRKAPALGVDLSGFLPAMLRLARERRNFAELNAAVQLAQTQKGRNRHLRRELAMGLACLRKEAAAQEEWAALIRTGEMEQDDWLAFSKCMMNTSDPGLTLRIMSVIAACVKDGTNPFLQYCVAKYFVEGDRGRAPRALERIRPAAIPDAEILLDVAILCWRVRDFRRAEEAATLLTNRPDALPVSEAVLRSVRSFAGDAPMLPAYRLPLAGPLAGQLVTAAESIGRDSSSWGFFHRKPARRLCHTALDLQRDPAMVVPEALAPIATFSILSERLGPDPYRLLCGVDWSWPHFMLQRRPQGDLVHVFIEAHEHGHWPWKEVDVVGQDEQEDAVDDRRSEMWTEIAHELEYEEES